MEQNSELQTVLMEAAVKKLNEQNAILEQVREQTAKGQDLQPQLESIRNELAQIRKGDLFTQVFTQEIKALKAPLVSVLKLLNDPKEQTTEHHHHFPKLVWLTVVLFFLCVLLMMGWNSSSGKLEDYKVNDSKYRFLKLQDGKTWHAKLRWVDSLYKVRPNMLDSVNGMEEDRNKKLELLRQALEMEKQAKLMRKSVGQKPHQK